MPLLLLLALFGCAAPDTVAVSERGSLSRGSDVNSASSGAPPMALLAATTSLLVGDSATVSVRDPLAGEYARRRMFGAATTVSYRVSDTAVVRVAPTGTVYAIRAGEAWLHANLRDWSDSALFSVSSRPDTGGATPPGAPPVGDPPLPPPAGRTPDGAIAKAAELPRREVELPPELPAKRVLAVNAGGNLQAALDTARPGDHIVLQRGAVFSGQYFLRKKNGAGTDWITIRSAGALPSKGTRVTPSSAAEFATLQATSGGSAAALRADPGASRYHVVGVRFTMRPDLSALGVLISMYPAIKPTSLADFPNHIVLDRLWIHGQPLRDLRVCVRLTGQHLALINSYVAACHDRGNEAQGVESFSGDGPLLIENNYIEGAGQGFFLGGADSPVTGDVPTDVTIRRNHFRKPESWNRVYLVKNGAELKTGRRVLIEENVVENVWRHGQTGNAFVINATNQTGQAPWSVTEDVTLRRNMIEGSHLAFNLSSRPNLHPAVGTRRVTIEDNYFVRLGEAIGDNGNLDAMAINSSNEPLEDVLIRRNSFVARVPQNSLIQMDGVKNGRRLEFVRNAATVGRYGLKGDGSGFGTSALNGYWASGYVFTQNLLVGTPQGAPQYPADNFWAPTISETQIGADDEILPSSAYGFLTLGYRIGAPVAELRTLASFVRSP